MSMSKFLYDGPLDELEVGHSTGPKTPEGRAKSSQNALRHGCCSQATIIKGESETEGGEEEVEAMEAIHVLDQWVDVVIENGRAVTRIEPSNEQLLEDRLKMNPAPQQVCRRFHFRGGIPEEYAWSCETEEQRRTQ